MKVENTEGVSWHGTQQELFSLVNSIARNCGCQFGMLGMRVSTCEAHLMMRDDQRALNGLLFGRIIRTVLLKEEEVLEEFWPQVLP